MAQPDDYDQREDLDWFRDELRQRDRLIADLRQEQDEAADLIRRLREHGVGGHAGSANSWPLYRRGVPALDQRHGGPARASVLYLT